MERSEFWWQTEDELAIYGQSWEPLNPRAIFCLTHGQGEHSGRYAHVAEALVATGIAVFAFDLRGHGRSEGKRGYTPSYQTLIDDVDRLQAHARRHHSDLPLFLFGHSMGGNCVLNYCLRCSSSVTGVIVSAPWLQLNYPIPSFLALVLKYLNRWIPKFTIRSDVPIKLASRAERVVDRFLQDPLTHNCITIRMLWSLYQSGRYALSRANHFSIPLLLMHGQSDRVIDSQASREFAKDAPYCTLKLWPDLYHEILNEPENGMVISYMIDWIDARLAESVT